MFKKIVFEFDGCGGGVFILVMGKMNYLDNI